MKAYNEQWIYNRTMLEQAGRWHRQKLLSDTQMKAVRKTYPVEFRQTNGFLEIGLFLFTTVAILACYLLPASLFMVLTESSVVYGLFNMAAGVVIGLVGNLLIKRRLLYRNGIDNAFVVTMAGFLAFGFNQLISTELSIAAHCFLTLPLLLIILWYYGDTLIAFFVVATFYTGVFNGLLTYAWGKEAMPFVMMALSLVLYLGTVQIQRANPKETYYTDPLNLIQWFSLIMLVAGGNYFIVRELNGLLLERRPGVPLPKEAPEIALSGLFWLLTFLIPGMYVGRGFAKKDRMLLVLGLLGLIGAAATVHAYAALVPLNVALTLGGLILIGLAVVGIRYIAQPKYGFTDEPDDDSPNEFFTNVATVAAVQATGAAVHGPKDNLRFGEGDFGGGGAEGRY
ncbi:hypothetical protein [Spirosoma luteum]|uniref:hypothetical protein n=1 Tax=Spirosoma luteum TaxID=431553 RepID=UPI0003794DEC|nr:hypothetical protein [Spirosoma luteum]